MRTFRVLLCSAFILLALVPLAEAQPSEPPLTLKQFFSAVSIGPVRISPDGRSVVIQTRRTDWAKNIFRKDLWLYRERGGLIPLTQSESDTDPQWSPDGKWIAFLSTREEKPAGPASAQTPAHIPQVYVIRADGGEAIRLTGGAEEVHSFAWSSDSRSWRRTAYLIWTSLGACPALGAASSAPTKATASRRTPDSRPNPWINEINF